MVFKSIKNKVSIRRLSQSYSSGGVASTPGTCFGAAAGAAAGAGAGVADSLFFNTNKNLKRKNENSTATTGATAANTPSSPKSNHKKFFDVNLDNNTNNNNHQNSSFTNDNMKFSNHDSKNSNKNYNVNNPTKFIVPILLTSTTNNNTTVTSTANATTNATINSNITNSKINLYIPQQSTKVFNKKNFQKKLTIIKRRRKYLLSANLKNNLSRFQNNKNFFIDTNVLHSVPNSRNVSTSLVNNGNGIINYNNLHGKTLINRKNKLQNSKYFYSTKTNYSNDIISNDPPLNGRKNSVEILDEIRYSRAIAKAKVLVKDKSREAALQQQQKVETKVETSTATAFAAATTNIVNKLSNVTLNGNDHLKIENTNVFEENNIDNIWPWEIDYEESLNKDSYLLSHTNKINENFNQKNYNIILPLYQSLKRNNCIPSLETYYKILYSLVYRKFDSNDINYKMFQILSVYEDIIIKNKLKPNEKIYNLVLQSLLTSSIKISNKQNGLDFYKIAIEFFQQIHSRYVLSNELVIKNLLIAINHYPNFANNLTTEKIIKLLNSTQNFSLENNYKIYYKSLINYSILTNDVNSFKNLAQSYELLIKDNQQNGNNNIIVQDYTISSLIILGNILIKGDIQNATVLFHEKLNEILNSSNNKYQIFELIKNFILSISIINPTRGYELLLNFKNKIEWLPDFDYQFYLNLINYSSNNWELIRKYYDFIYALPVSVKDGSQLDQNNQLIDIDQILLLSKNSHISFNSIHDFLISQSYQLSDLDMISKIIHESMVKKIIFNDMKSYELIFDIFNNNQNIYSNDLINNFVEVHGELIKEKFFNEKDLISNDMDHEELFYTHNLTPLDSFLNLLLQKKIYDSNDNSIFSSTFFENYCNLSNIFNVYTIMNLKNCLDNYATTALKDSSNYKSMLEFYSKLVLKINNVDLLLNIHNSNMAYMKELNSNDKNNSASNSNSNVMNFDQNLLNSFNELKTSVQKQFKHLIVKYNELNFDPTILSDSVFQSLKFFDFSIEINNYYNGNLGDWDRSYPVSLAPTIRKSESTGLREFQKLSKNGYKFDFQTYMALISSKSISYFINKDIIINSINSCLLEGLSSHLKPLVNLICKNLKYDQINEFILSDKDLFNDYFINNLTDISLGKLIQPYASSNFTKPSDYMNFQSLMELIDFPNKYHTINNQTKYINSLASIYSTLFEQNQFGKIIKFNDIVPVQDTNMLLLCYLNSGNFSKFTELFDQYKNVLHKEQVVMLKAEYLILKSNSKEAVTLIQNYLNSVESNAALSKNLSNMLIKALFNLSLTDSKYASKLMSSFKVSNDIQLSYILSSYSNNFSQMILEYENYKTINSNIDKQILLDRMLQNYYSVVSIQSKSSENLFELNVLDSYLKNYFRFKCYLMNSSLTFKDISTIMDIWSQVNPAALNSLFNNIMESIYLNPKSETIYILNDFSFNFKPLDLISIIRKIKSYYSDTNTENSNEEIISKIDKSLNFINNIYSFQRIIS